MNRITLSGGIAIVAFLTFSAKAENLPLEGIMSLSLDCQVEQASGTTNMQINTQALLELIAKDQSFELPPHAKLWLTGDSFAVLKQDNTVFTLVDTNILNLTYGATVLKSTASTDSIRQKFHTVAIKGTSVVGLNYNGSSISFSLNFVGENDLFNQVFSTYATYTRSFTSSGLGSGKCGDHDVVITGTLTGKYSYRYSPGGTGTFPTSAFPN